MNTYNEMIVLDTNIILNDHNNLETISNHSENILVLPEIVLDELDSKKSGFEEINYQARAFGRLLDTADVIKTYKKDDLFVTETFINGDKQMTVLVVSKRAYRADKDRSIPDNIRNDRKIIEVADDIRGFHDGVTFMTLDIMCRFRALSVGVPTKKYIVNQSPDTVLTWKLEVDQAHASYDAFELEAMDVPKTVQGIEIIDGKGSHFYHKSGNVFIQVDEADLKRQNVKPRNVGQKILSSMILDDTNDVIVSDSPAGSGKTLIALSNAMKLMDTNKGDNKYDKIIYIRKTVISDDEELGFMPGSLEEKMSGFLAPLYSNLEFIVEQKYKKQKLTPEETQTKMDELISKYNIQVKYEGHLRGGNIRNAIVIWDEAQNNSVSSAKTILTRVGENSLVIVLGSNRQIDSKYLNKFNNALTYLLNRIGEDNMNVTVTGYRLEKTVRSNIAEWADTFKG